MINKNEVLFTVDENNQPITPAARQKVHTEAIWHRTNDIVVMNSKNEILCSKRSRLKDISPGLWDASFGGHVLAGVDDMTSALDELKEEAGLEPNRSDLDFVSIVRHSEPQKNNNEFRYLYIYRWDGPLNELKLEEDEVDEVKWVPIDDIINNKNNREEWSPMPYLDELLKKISYERS